MLGSYGNPINNPGIEILAGRPNVPAPPKKTKKQEQFLNQLIDREWSELPYAMMRLTAARRPWDENRVYWRDCNVQLGDLDLNLVKAVGEDDAPCYTASYTQDELRCDFTLHPSLETDQLRWSAPGITNGLKLTTTQLAEKLLAKLVTFYATGLTAPASSACPSLSS